MQPRVRRLGGGAPVGYSRLAAALRRSSRLEDGRLEPAVDVFGAGAILTHLLSQASGRPRRATLDALARLAQRATAADRAERPTARELADGVHDAVLGARLPRRGAGAATSSGSDLSELRRRQRPLERWRRAHVSSRPARHRLHLVLPVVGLVVLALGGALFHAGSAEDAPSTAATPSEAGAGDDAPDTTEPEVAPSAVTLAPTTLPVRQPQPVPAGCPVVEAVWSADVDGDGCADVVRFADGVVEAAQQRWAVGQPDDLAAVGDWTCRGARSLALLRPATGEVFAFDGWASAEREAHAPLLARVAGGRTLRAADLDADGCHELVVERTTGAPAVLRVARPAGS